MKARIFQKPKNAMQSGRAGTQRWMLEFAPAEARKGLKLLKPRVALFLLGMLFRRGK